MKRLICIFLAAIAVQAYGQQNFASISFGVSQPLGAYASTESLSNSGYAKAGGTIKFDVAWFPVSYLGFAGSFSFGSNYSVGDALLEDIVAHIEENGSGLIDIPDYANRRYTSGFWNYINIFIGPHFSFRASQRLYFDLRLAGGPSVLRMPDQSLQITFDQTEINSTTSGNTLTLGFTAGGGLRFKLNSNIALKLGVDYSRSMARLDYAFDLFAGVAEEIPPIEAKFPVQAMEFTAGLAYSF